jgi:hypothetical protein
MFLRTIAVLGLIAVLILGAWGIIQLAVAIPAIFSNLGSGTSSLLSGTNAQENVTVSTAATITSGQTLQVSWTHANADTSAQYSYAISYACQTGLSLGAPVPTGSYQTVACNTPFNYVNAGAHMTVIPVLTGGSSAPLVITVTATELSTGTITATGVSTTTVAPSGKSTATQTTTPVAHTTTTKSSTGATYYPATTRAALYGYPDLAVQILSATPNGTRTTVEFVIQNVGTNIVASGWTFNATLPINGSYTFASQPQQALYPGDKIVYALTFDNVYGQNTYQQYPNYGYGYTGASSYTTGGYTCNGYNCTTPYGYNNYYNNCTNNSCNNGYYNYNGMPSYTGTVTITADPFNYVTESNKSNNSASIVVQVY